MELGALLRKLRKEAGLTQEELARALDINQSSISFIERDERATTTRVLSRWAEVCGYRLTLVGPAQAPLMEAAESLAPADLDLVTQLARVASRLQPEMRQLLHGVLQNIESRGGASLTG